MQGYRQSLSGYIGHSLSNRLYISNIQQVSHLLTGAPNDTAPLTKAFAAGALLNTDLTKPSTNLYDIQLQMENAFYSLLIPQAWNLTGTGHRAIIVQSGACNQQSPWHGTSSISDDDATKARICDVPGALDKPSICWRCPTTRKPQRRRETSLKMPPSTTSLASPNSGNVIPPFPPPRKTFPAAAKPSSSSPA